jgi:hypothetical protein
MAVINGRFMPSFSSDWFLFFSTVSFFGALYFSTVVYLWHTGTSLFHSYPTLNIFTSFCLQFLSSMHCPFSTMCLTLIPTYFWLFLHFSIFIFLFLLFLLFLFFFFFFFLLYTICTSLLTVLQLLRVSGSTIPI